jgi:hypothetical protein
MTNPSETPNNTGIPGSVTEPKPSSPEKAPNSSLETVPSTDGTKN